MLRRLLACLALLTGLLATGATARAEAVGASLQIEASASALRSQTLQAPSVSQASAPASKPIVAEVAYRPVIPAHSAPSVRLLSDRARE